MIRQNFPHQKLGVAVNVKILPIKILCYTIVLHSSSYSASYQLYWNGLVIGNCMGVVSKSSRHLSILGDLFSVHDRQICNVVKTLRGFMHKL